MNRLATFLRDYSFARFILPLGLILIVFGGMMYGIMDKRKDYPQTDAVVTQVELYEEAYDEGNTHHDATYRTMVRYTVDGKDYEEEYRNGPEMKVGAVVRIDYNPLNPQDISQPTGAWLPIGMMAAGVGCLAAGIISIVKTRKKNKALYGR